MHNSNAVRIMFVGAVLVGALALVGVVVLLQRLPKNEQGGGVSTNQPSATAAPVAEDPSYVPTAQRYLVDPNEVKGLYRITGVPSPTAALKYRLSPLLKEKDRQLNTDVKGATSCDVSGFPEKVMVYKLKKHVNEVDAKSIVEDWGVEGTLSSMSDGADSFTYTVMSDSLDSYVSISEASGVYTYHITKPSVDPSSSPALSESALSAKADEIFSRTGVADFEKRIEPSKLESPGGASFTGFIYHKKWNGGIPVHSVGSFIGIDSVCNIEEGLINSIQVQLYPDGQISTVKSMVRTEINKSEVTRLSLEDALVEHGPNPVYGPFVLGSGSSVPNGEVEITEATLFYLDLGTSIAQDTFIPTYAISGVIDGVKIVTFIYAVKGDTLDKIAPAAASNSQDGKDSGADPGNSTQKQSTFFISPSPIPPPSSTPFPTGFFTSTTGATGGSGSVGEGGTPGVAASSEQPSGMGNIIGLCTGGQIDIYITCRLDGVEFISNVFTAVGTKNDPMEVCTKGSQNVELELYYGGDDYIEGILKNPYFQQYSGAYTESQIDIFRKKMTAPGAECTGRAQPC